MPRIPIAALARELNLPIATLLTQLVMMGLEARTARSSLDTDTAERVKAEIGSGGVGQQPGLKAVPTHTERDVQVLSGVRVSRLPSKIPAAPHRRRVIAVASPNFGELRTADEQQSVALIIPPTRPPSSELDLSLYRRGLLEPGMVLIQSPLDNTRYQPLDDAAESFALDKLLLYDRVAGLLGATKFSVEELLVQSDAGSLSVRGGAKAPIGQAKGHFDKSQSDKFQRFMEVGSTNAAGPPDVEAAQRLVDDAGLASEPTLSHLIAVVRDGVRKKTQTLRLNLTREVSRTLDLGAEVSNQIKIGGSGGVERRHDQVNDVQILLRVEF
ncbi:translation initiation factor IF-2 N-terminal domain-containing protein [Pedococcus bigeumensis]|uniref:Translation initiation factor IF-2 N-terminal domain-containing protein n=1 Tax=Pedococcus bigeumensis TaxID=433644 RepID=A0A502CKP4_9MICO|nr:translation initiation factor IF-2 N-terminal domain-containing protein [Pedococcus bigeumensis]TPG12251.1 hypothetical protein EAH86_20205 [Pedococcus bigeumensis]